MRLDARSLRMRFVKSDETSLLSDTFAKEGHGDRKSKHFFGFDPEFELQIDHTPGSHG
jgi:hypothetical protein